jgi:rod shape-determining protein MreC
MENHFLNSELRTADRVKALSVFQSRTPSRTLAARIIGAGAGTNSKAVFVDRGSVAGVMRGMAVVTPDGIAGKVIAAYPTASEVMLVTDSEFAAGVVSQKNEIRGTLKGQGYAICKVDYVPPEQKVEVGEMFYTSGDDRIFPKGFPVGQVKVVRNASPFKEILVEPAALRRGLEEVLVLLQGVHQEIPEATAVLAMAPVYIAPAPPPDPKAAPVPAVPASAVGTDADRLRARYQAIGEAQKHVFGGGSPWAPPPNFNLKPPAGGAAPPAAPKPASSATPASGAPRTAAGAPPAASTPSKPPAPKPTAPNASGTPPATASAPPAAPPTPAPAAKPKPPAPGDPL